MTKNSRGVTRFSLPRIGLPDRGLHERGFAPILIVVILGLIGIVSYLVLAQSLKQTPTAPSSPTPKPTQESPENWKTYSSSQYSFSIKYPSNLSPEKSENDIYLNLVSFGNVSDEQNVWFSVSVRDTKIEDEVKFVKWQYEHALVTLVKEEKLLVNGYPAVKLEYESQRPDVGPPTTSIIVNNGKYSYAIDSRTESIDQILSTFKFLGFTKENALEKVRNLPEVQEYMKIVPNVRFMVEESSENPNIWTVHVFEDKETHITTFNWYEVDKETGKVKPVF